MKVEVFSQQTGDIDPVLDQCWATVYDAGPTLVQHWVDVSCVMQSRSCDHTLAFVGKRFQIPREKCWDRLLTWDQQRLVFAGRAGALM